MKNQRKLLAERVGEVVAKARRASLEMSASFSVVVQGIGRELARLVPVMERVVDVASRNLKDETVPVTDNVFRGLPSRRYRTFFASSTST